MPARHLNSPRAARIRWSCTIRIRPIAWYDLWSLYRYRQQALYFDNALAFTRVPSLGKALFGSLNPHHICYTGYYRSRQDGLPLYGQVNYRAGDHSARLAFLLPQRHLDTPGLLPLLEDLAWEAANHGALHLLAEVNESLDVVEPLRRAGFSVYAWQSLWRFDGSDLQGECLDGCWQPMHSVQEFAVHTLYQTLAPPLVQGAEPINGRPLKGLVYLQDGEVLGYAEAQSGPRGIYLTPVIHPNISRLEGVLYALVRSLCPRGSRPVILGVRSYQSWVQPALMALGAQPGPHQALMMKHMVQTQRVLAPVHRAAALEKAQPVLAGPTGERLPLNAQPAESAPPAAPRPGSL